MEIGLDGLTVKSVVIAKGARKLTLARVLRSYSVGIANPTIARDASAPGGKIVGGSIVELSLCDTPSNPSCGVVIAKAGPAGHPVYVGQAWGSAVLVKGGRRSTRPADGLPGLRPGRLILGSRKFCTGCGSENPHYTPMADRKLPMNEKGARVKRKTAKKAGPGVPGGPAGDRPHQGGRCPTVAPDLHHGSGRAVYDHRRLGQQRP